MKIKVRDGNVQLHSLIKPIAIGHALGWGTLMLPILLLALPTMLLAPNQIEGNVSPVIQLLIMPIMLPVILILQGVMIGCMATLGLWVYRSRGKIEIEETHD